MNANTNTQINSMIDNKKVDDLMDDERSITE